MSKLTALVFRVILPVLLSIGLLFVSRATPRKLVSDSEFIDWMVRFWLLVVSCYYYWKIPTMHATQTDHNMMSFWYGINKQPYASRKQLATLYVMGSVVSAVGWSFILGGALWTFVPILRNWLLPVVIIHGAIFFAGVLSRLNAYLDLHERAASD